MIMQDVKAVAIVGVGAILPDAFDAPTFWKNIRKRHYSIVDVPPERWREDLYFNSDPTVPDKTYSKIGGWVRDYKFEPLKAGIPIPPRVLDVMDEAQQWALAASRQALMDYGHPGRSLNLDRTAVILGNAMAGEGHYRSTMRILLPEYLDLLSSLPDFEQLPKELQSNLLNGMQKGMNSRIPKITEDTMPGELGNIIAGRVANIFNLGGPNFVTDAACASSLAALQSAAEGLAMHRFDAALVGGVDRNMGPESFVKFSKIGALSPDGSRPFAEGANGFVMGEGAAILLIKRLEDAEKDGDDIYAVVRGIGGSSDGKGKGITAPNPIGQRRAISRAWENAGVSPASVGMIEAHGTSTRVGDVAEVNSLVEIFGNLGLSVGSVALGSVKSNIGHLKSAAGAVGLLKTAFALRDRVLPPSANFHRPNPNIDFANLPFSVNSEERPWEVKQGEVRRAGVSAFGFGGTNFHVVMEEYRPGMLRTEKIHSVPAMKMSTAQSIPETVADAEVKPYRGLLFISANTTDGLKKLLIEQIEHIRKGESPPSKRPTAAELGRMERLAIDYDENSELLKRCERTLKVMDSETPAAWKAMTAHGVFRGSGKPGKVAFLFPGQGSQYVNMLRDLYEMEPEVAATFHEADEIMEPILGRKLTSFIFVDGDEASLKAAEQELRNTEITQPAVLTVNVALLRTMRKFGFQPDLVIGHSLGEYAALVASGLLSFADALKVVSARGREMTKVSVADNGAMAAVSAPLEDVEKILSTIEGYVVIANINSPVQSVIGGATAAVDAAVVAFTEAGMRAVKLPVSHGFHTDIVAPASEPLKRLISGMDIQKPAIQIVANVTGDLYPKTRDEIVDILGRQVASPVQFIKGVHKLYDEGARVFVEVGPKRALSAMANDILKDQSGKLIVSTNHPRKGGPTSFNEALCTLYAGGVGADYGVEKVLQRAVSVSGSAKEDSIQQQVLPENGRLPLTGSVVVSGAGLGLPGRNKRVFQDDNIQRILKGEMMIEPFADDTRSAMVEKRVVRLVKSESGAVMDPIDDLEKTVKLAGQSGGFSPTDEFGIPQERVDAIDISTQLAIAAGIEALRDAGIPLVKSYRTTSKNTLLPDRWKLPEALADETGVIFASAFPGLERMAEAADQYYTYQNLKMQMEELSRLRVLSPNGNSDLGKAVDLRIQELQAQLEELDYHFDRRFVFQVLAMGHSQFAEYVGARGPNTHVNAACASTTHAMAVAEDWIRAGRCRRVVIVAGDDITDGNLASWIGTSMMASGAATIEGDPRKAILPFDRRRNGLIMGMGAAGLVVESEDAVRERGMRGICELLSSQIANSAFHGTRLDVPHVSMVMNNLVSEAESRFGIHREDIASETVFVSHETYTPARGGSASAEINALRHTFDKDADSVVIANTKGFTGHTMGVGIEDVLAVKALEYGVVPPIANIGEGFEPDPELGSLNLSKGGEYPVQYALRLGAGFGSQIAMTLLRKVPGFGERIDQQIYSRWLADVSGYEAPELEVAQRTLRIRHNGPPKNILGSTVWQYGNGPTVWAASQQNENSMPAQHLEVSAIAVDNLPSSSEQEKVGPVSVQLPQEITNYVLDLVSEKTGYPPEMLDLELDLEADLGVDTVKQAELFANIREHYSIPKRDDLRLSDYNTLKKVIHFMQDALASSVPEGIAQPEAKPSRVESGIQDYVLSIVSEKTGYPPEMLDLDLDLEADLGVDTVKQAELFATVREQYGIPRREDLRLSDYNTLSKVIGFVQEALSSESQPAGEQPEKQGDNFPTAQPISDGSGIEEYVLSVVSEKTGYPPEMLDLDLDLEADLGVDTVKQAELFATVREQYGIPRREDLRLSDYNTLSKVIGFVQEALSSESQPAGEQSEKQGDNFPAAQPISDGSGIEEYVLSVVSEKTGYPPEMLDLDLDLEADLGVDTVKQAELFATVREQYGIPRREDLRLSDYNTLSKVIGFVQEAQASEVPQTAVDVEAEVGKPQVDVPVPEKSEIQDYVVSVVSEKTGYPSEMLDLDLDLEADLGIDTVKQAELFATVREHYNIPRREDLRLSEYNSLAKVIQFIIDSKLELPVPIEEPEEVVAEFPGIVSTGAEDVPATRVEFEKKIIRRVPAPVLRPRLDVCRSTDVVLNEETRVVVVKDQGKVSTSLLRRLRGRKVQVLVLEAAQSEDEMMEKLNPWLEDGAATGVYFLPGLDIETPFQQMTAKEWQTTLNLGVHTLYALMRNLPNQPYLVCATRMGGLHGFSVEGASAPMGGSITGFTKAYSRERVDSFVKVVDFEQHLDDSVVAARLIDETVRDPGVVEVGWENDLRYGIAVVDQDLPSDKNYELKAGSVFLVSGGTGGITSPIIMDLAESTKGSFHLLGRTALPDPSDPDLGRLKEDIRGLRKDLMERMAAESKSKVTPAQVERRLSALTRGAATLEMMASVKSAGGNASYYICDVVDAEAVRQVIDKVVKAEGRVDVLIHAAGVESSRKLESKPTEEFSQIIDVKATGFFNLFKALEQASALPSAIAMFTSVAGRFGNAGQVDYCAANDLLSKLASAFRNLYPSIHCVALDWGAWAEVGMASRGYIPALMERAGIDMMLPQEAAPLVRAELEFGCGESVLAGSLGLLMESQDPAGGVDLEKANAALREGKPIHKMFSSLTGLDTNLGITLEADLDPTTEAFLKDHALNGTPVLPGVMGIEGFSTAAKHISSALASARGFEVTHLEDIEFLSPFKFHRDKPRRITWPAQVIRETAGLVVSVILESTQTLHMKSAEKVLHFSGKVHLEQKEISAHNTKPPHWNGGATVGSADIYRLYFHGPSFQVLEGVQCSGTHVLGKLQSDLPPLMAGSENMISMPALVELCFQTAGIWEAGSTGVLGLPRSIQNLTLFRGSTNGTPIYADVKPRQDKNGLSFDARVVDAKGQVYLEIEGYRTSPLPYSVETDLLEPLKVLVCEL
jgi:malonyl CoA-acyl carrier protein transacylase